MNESKLKSCKFCEAFESTSEHVGECHKHPPLVWISKEAYERLPKDVSRDIYDYRWPIVDWDDWCYEFVQISWDKIREIVAKEHKDEYGARIPEYR